MIIVVAIYRCFLLLSDLVCSLVSLIFYSPLFINVLLLFNGRKCCSIVLKVDLKALVCSMQCSCPSASYNGFQ